MSYSTHIVINQPGGPMEANLYECDVALQEALGREGATWADDELRADGAIYGSARLAELGELANRHPPELRLFDRYGRRLDEVRFHPAWHEVMALGAQRGLHTGPWANPREGAHVKRAAQCFIHSQAEAGSQCPLTMTYGSIPSLRKNSAIAERWLPVLLRPEYDPRLVPIEEKRGALIGMGMTEKQGGSDVRTNSTVAAPTTESGAFQLTGHKWFVSAPMCDAFLMLAQAPGGLTCFFVPRILDDGSKNALRLQRLKDKLGNRSNASSEVELFGALGWPVGDEGRGVPTIIEMATYTRLDCTVGSAALMRAALSHALHHAARRTTFGRKLADAPLMLAVLADLALESEASTALAMRLARAFDHQDDPLEIAVRRVLTPAAKFFVCKRALAFTGEAMEALGGIGYVEEAPMARLYREAPVNSIWEGSGNVMCLDVLRAAAKSPESVEALRAELQLAVGANVHYDRFVEHLFALWRQPQEALEAQGRTVTQAFALAAQASLLLRHSPNFVSDAFCATRLDPGHHHTFGALPPGISTRAIAERAAGALWT